MADARNTITGGLRADQPGFHRADAVIRVAVSEHAACASASSSPAATDTGAASSPAVESAKTRGELAAHRRPGNSPTPQPPEPAREVQQKRHRATVVSLGHPALHAPTLRTVQST